MRNLKTTDLFRVMRIVRKADIKKKLVDLDLTGLDEQQFGIMLILEIVDAAPEAEREIYEFLSDVSEVSVEDIENDEFDLLNDIIEHLKGQEKLVSFLKQAFTSMT